MKRKVIVIAGVIAVAAIAITVFMKMMGGSGVGIDNNPELEVKGDSNVLVAYFSWSGNGQQMAKWISEETGGELFRIVPSEHIDIETMAQYDVIYLGFPVWWYDLPMPVWTFLEEYDLSGKTVIPFFSHNGSSNGANSVNRVKELANGATVLTENALSLRGSNVADSEKEVKDWVKNFSK